MKIFTSGWSYLRARISAQTVILLAGLLLALLQAAGRLEAFPASDQWLPIYRGGVILQDPNGDANGSRNIVSDPTHAPLFIYNDGTYINFRLRLDKDPTGTGGQGLLQAYGWGIEFDTNGDAGNYEWLLMCDGIASPELIELYHNTVTGTLGDPGDKAEVLAATVPLSGNYQVVPADTSFNGDLDYFLDFRFPYATFKSETGLTDDSPLRLFAGSSPSTNNLTANGGDLLGASDLYAGFSDPITPLGTRPTTGTVRFVTTLGGSLDLDYITSGDTIFIRVDDADQNYQMNTLQTVTVILRDLTSGDSETRILTETGINTGVFAGSITTRYAAPISGNQVLEVTPGGTVTVTYIDRIDANLQLNQLRTDTLQVRSPLLNLVKTVNPSEAAAGDTVTYQVTITNTGPVPGVITSIQDILPSGFTYRPGTTSGFISTDPSVSGQSLTWSGTWVIPANTGSLSFSFKAAVGPISGTYYNNLVVSGNNFVTVATGPTAPVQVGAPMITLAKSVSPAGSQPPGTILTYAVHYRNTGGAAAQNLIIMDQVPYPTAYQPGSLRMAAAGVAYSGATPKSDQAGDDAAEITGSTVVFHVGFVAADDLAADAGPDEGIVYFQVIIP